MSRLRIVGGRYAGLWLKTPRARSTHPMSERIRGALFNALGDLSGLSVLDAFGGSGALGLEAASRGAGEVVIIDNNKTAFKAASSNIESVGASNVNTSLANVYSWLGNQRRRFDVILADPPYDNFRVELIERLLPYLRPGGLIVVSAPSDEEFELDDLQFVQRRDYGEASLHYWRKNPGQ